MNKLIKGIDQLHLENLNLIEREMPEIESYEYDVVRSKKNIKTFKNL